MGQELLAIIEQIEREKGIKKEVIDQILNESCQDDDKSALELLEKIKSQYKKLEPQVARRRMYGFLLRRGFSYESVKNALKLSDANSINED